GYRLRRTTQVRGGPERGEHRGAQGPPARQELRQGRRGRGRGRRVVRAPGRRPVPRGARRRGDAQAGRRVHLHELLPGAPPLPARGREEADLQGLRL
ncbi:MAG: FIG01121218: hypothetical protein, partial [uncultured Nocardioides sp.]